MRLHDERGAALVVALGFLTFFGLVIGALLSFAGSSVLATERLRDQRASVYAADAAVDAAIQAGRLDPAVGAFGAIPCMDATSFATTATTSDATVASVTCTANQAPFTDRDVTFTATVGGSPVVVARARYLDSIDSTGIPTIQVLEWTYCGHDPGSCT